MIDLCQLNSSICQNNGQCTVNVSSNTTYCQCDQCHYGTICVNVVWRQGKYDTTYAYFIVSIIGVCLSMLNNGLIFELFIRCRRIRSTNCGIYLFVYSILSFLSNILLVIDQAVQYYPNPLINNSNRYGIFHCYVTKIGYHTLLYLCIWLSTCIAFERGLFIWFHSKINGTRCRSYVTIIVMLFIAVGSATPMLVYKCDWDNIPKLQTLRTALVWFYIIAAIAAHVVLAVLILISFARHIDHFCMENGSRTKTYFKLLCKHVYIFVPIIAFVICQLSYTIVINTKNPALSYFQCGISLGEFIVKVILESLTGLPYVLTWLLFVYPSRVYMTEFYLNTWPGQRLAQMLIFIKSYNGRKENVNVLPTANPTNDDRDNPLLRSEN